MPPRCWACSSCCGGGGVNRTAPRYRRSAWRPPCAPASGTSGTRRRCVRSSCARRRSCCSRARSGHCCRWSPRHRWGADPSRMGPWLEASAWGGCSARRSCRSGGAAAEGLTLDPAHIWDGPVVAEELAGEAGPVLVTVEYTLEPRHRPSFAAALRRHVRPIRQRDGAVFWELFVDAANPHRCVECYLVESWAEHLRQHGRTTQSDREVEDALRTF